MNASIKESDQSSIVLLHCVELMLLQSVQIEAFVEEYCFHWQHAVNHAGVVEPVPQSVQNSVACISVHLLFLLLVLDYCRQCFVLYAWCIAVESKTKNHRHTYIRARQRFTFACCDKSLIKFLHIQRRCMF